MIRITKYLYIHILTAALFAACFFTHRTFEITAAYAAMTLHELAHALAAVCIGLKISHITFYPFGVNMKLKNKIVCSLSDEIILYAAGPLVNAAIAILSASLYRHFPLYHLQYMYMANTALFAVNLLPALPLDGGIILKKILIHKFGNGIGVKVLKAVSFLTAMAMAAMGIYVVYITRFNFSVLLLSALVVGNIFTQKEKYNLDYIKELMFYKDKNKKYVAVKAADISESERDIVKSFDFGKYNIVFLVDEKGRIVKTLTETEIINKILKC